MTFGIRLSGLSSLPEDDVQDQAQQPNVGGGRLVLIQQQPVLGMWDGAEAEWLVQCLPIPTAKADAWLTVAWSKCGLRPRAWLAQSFLRGIGRIHQAIVTALLICQAISLKAPCAESWEEMSDLAWPCLQVNDHDWIFIPCFRACYNICRW